MQPLRSKDMDGGIVLTAFNAAWEKYKVLVLHAIKVHSANGSISPRHQAFTTWPRRWSKKD